MEREELAAELASRRWQELLALLYAARCLRPAGYHPSAQDSADYHASAQESADYYPCALADACIAALRRALCVDNVLPLAIGAHRCAAPTLLAEAFCLLRCHFHAPATVGAGLGLGLGPPPRYCAEGLQQGAAWLPHTVWDPARRAAAAIAAGPHSTRQPRYTLCTMRREPHTAVKRGAAARAQYSLRAEPGGELLLVAHEVSHEETLIFAPPAAPHGLPPPPSATEPPPRLSGASPYLLARLLSNFSGTQHRLYDSGVAPGSQPSPQQPQPHEPPPSQVRVGASVRVRLRFRARARFRFRTDKS